MERIDMEKEFLGNVIDALVELQGQVSPEDIENLEFLAKDMPKLLVKQLQGEDVEREIGFNRASLLHYSSAAQKVIMDTFADTVTQIVLKFGTLVIGAI